MADVYASSIVCSGGSNVVICFWGHNTNGASSVDLGLCMSLVKLPEHGPFTAKSINSRLVLIVVQHCCFSDLGHMAHTGMWCDVRT